MKQDDRLARFLINAVRNALSAGVQHYSKDGRLLTDELAILTALTRDGEIRCVNPHADIRHRN